MAGKSLATQASHAERIRNGLARWRDVPPGVIPESIANEFMAKIKSGSTVRKLTGGGAYGPPMVSLDRFKKHCELHPAWAVEVWRISRKNVVSLKGARKRALTHCSFGHPLSGDNVYMYIAPGRHERKCRACLRRRADTPVLPSAEQIQRATAALNAGKSITEVCTGKVNNKRVSAPIFSFNKLKLLRAKNPEFHKFVLSSSVGSGSRAQMRRYRPEQARRETMRAETNDFYTIVGMVPAYLPSDVRDDIAQSILLALLDGSLRRDQVKGRVQQFITGHNRMFPTKFAKFGDSPLVSLDEVLFDDGSTTRGDTVSRGLWD